MDLDSSIASLDKKVTALTADIEKMKPMFEAWQLFTSGPNYRAPTATEPHISAELHAQIHAPLHDPVEVDADKTDKREMLGAGRPAEPYDARRTGDANRPDARLEAGRNRHEEAGRSNRHEENYAERDRKAGLESDQVYRMRILGAAGEIAEKNTIFDTRGADLDKLGARYNVTRVAAAPG